MSCVHEVDYNRYVGLASVLSVDRVLVSNEIGGGIHDKKAALKQLSVMLGAATKDVSSDQILGVLNDREAVQSTGVGGGVAVPHGAVADLNVQVGALLLCPDGIPFDAIDDEPVHILFALIGPRGAPAQHLKILARMSRLLRNASFRENLGAAPRGSVAYDLIVGAEREGR